MIIDEYLAEIHEALGNPTATKPVPPERYDQFAGIFPPLLLRMWQTYGFAGFCDGRAWLCDPVEWQPAVDAWTDGLDPHLAMGPDTWHAITRTAFGEFNLWGERTGCSLSILPVHGQIYQTSGAAQEMNTENDRNLQIFAEVLEFPDEDLFGSDDKKLFTRALKAHGPSDPTPCTPSSPPTTSADHSPSRTSSSTTPSPTSSSSPTSPPTPSWPTSAPYSPTHQTPPTNHQQSHNRIRKDPEPFWGTSG